MCAHQSAEPRSAGSRSVGSRSAAVLTWLGGGDWRELTERHERSNHAIVGVVVLADAALVWLVAALALAGSTHVPMPAILAITLLFAVLIGAVTRAIASGPTRGRRAVAARAAVAVAVGVIVGELAALVVLSGSIDRRLDEQAAGNADSAPAVVQASTDLNQARAARVALDAAVEQARGHRDQALVVARCEYNPTPACPQTQITGVPGAGPETRTADELLADAQRELDDALAARDQQAPGLDAQIAASEQTVALARQAATAHADRGLGARWIAMYDRTFADAGVLLLQLVTIAFFTLLGLLPLILKLWRGDTTHDRSAAARAERDRAELAARAERDRAELAARAERDRAELEADTAIAVKRAQVRAAAETLWAEQQLANARLAVAAQTEIDGAQHRRRVVEAQRDEDMYLPIAAEAEAAAEAASRAAVQLPASAPRAGDEEPDNLPVAARCRRPGSQAEPADRPREGGPALVPSIPDVARAAARWVRPLVPSFVARAIDTTSQPLRAARHVFEEVEEITFTLKRTHKVTVHSEENTDLSEENTDRSRQPGSVATETAPAFPAPAGAVDVRRMGSPPPPSELAGRAGRPELTERDAPRELPHGQRQLPPAE